MAQRDTTTAVLQSAIHFEWTLKRVIKKMGTSPTKALGERLVGVYSFKNDNSQTSYFRIWKEEIRAHYNNAALGTVLGSYQSLKAQALDVRGTLAHGNGRVSDSTALSAIDAYFTASAKLRDFAKRHGFDVDERLASRPATRKTK